MSLLFELAMEHRNQSFAVRERSLYRCAVVYRQHTSDQTRKDRYLDFPGSALPRLSLIGRALSVGVYAWSEYLKPDGAKQPHDLIRS